VRMTVQSQKGMNSLANPAHYEYRQRYDGEGDLWEVMLQLKVDEVEGAAEEPETATNWVRIVMCWLQLSHTGEGRWRDAMVQVDDKNSVAGQHP
jgi:hypothetical protein